VCSGVSLESVESRKDGVLKMREGGSTDSKLGFGINIFEIESFSNFPNHAFRSVTIECGNTERRSAMNGPNSFSPRPRGPVNTLVDGRSPQTKHNISQPSVCAGEKMSGRWALLVALAN
jgi:hypothetical protein